MHFKPAEVTAAVDAVIRSRKTVRAFRPEQVPRGSQLVEVLEMARTAPSTFNTQPRRILVLVGRAKQKLSEAILKAHIANSHPPHSALPNPAPPDYVARQADFGHDDTTLGVDRTEHGVFRVETGCNFVFFDAPVGLIFTIDATLTKHSWLDCGLFMQNFILAAQARGLATCPQVSLVRYQSVIAEQLELAPEDLVVCGMSLGYADERAPLNRMGMPRDPLETFVCWRGFDE